MAKKIGRGGELFAQLCDPEHLIQSARAAGGDEPNALIRTIVWRSQLSERFSFTLLDSL